MDVVLYAIIAIIAAIIILCILKILSDIKTQNFIMGLLEHNIVVLITNALLIIGIKLKK